MPAFVKPLKIYYGLHSTGDSAQIISKYAVKGIFALNHTAVLFYMNIRKGKISAHHPPPSMQMLMQP